MTTNKVFQAGVFCLKDELLLLCFVTLKVILKHRQLYYIKGK